MKPPEWRHHVYEKWELSMDKVHVKIEKHSHGPYIRIGLDASARGAECYADEIDRLIEALQEAKVKCKELTEDIEQTSYTKKGKGV